MGGVHVHIYFVPIWEVIAIVAVVVWLIVRSVKRR